MRSARGASLIGWTGCYHKPGKLWRRLLLSNAAQNELSSDGVQGRGTQQGLLTATRSSLRQRWSCKREATPQPKAMNTTKQLTTNVRNNFPRQTALAKELADHHVMARGSQTSAVRLITTTFLKRRTRTWSRATLKVFELLPCQKCLDRNAHKAMGHKAA